MCIRDRAPGRPAGQLWARGLRPAARSNRYNCKWQQLRAGARSGPLSCGRRCKEGGGRALGAQQ
eukprot:14846959-Alexandrium_andersonii.AAC.1